MVALRALILAALATSALAQNGVCQAECGSLNEHSSDPCSDASKAAIKKCADCAETTNLQSLKNATLQLQHLCDPAIQASVSSSRAAASASASAAAAAKAANASHSNITATAAVTGKPSSASATGLGLAGASVAVLAVAAVACIL